MKQYRLKKTFHLPEQITLTKGTVVIGYKGLFNSVIIKHGRGSLIISRNDLIPVPKNQPKDTYGND